MSVTLIGTEGFFTRHGAWIGEYNRVGALYGSALDAGFQSIWSQYVSSDQAAVQQLPDAVSAFRASAQSYQSTLVSDGIISTNLQVARDTSVVPATFARAIQIVADQMVVSADSINRPTIASVVAAGGSNLGDAGVYFSNTNIYGDPLDMTVAEVITITCTSGDSFTASFGVVGETPVEVTAYNWPQGSGVSTSITAVDPATDGIVTNGSFETFTVANTPDDWTIINGAAGVTVFQSVGGGVRTGTDAVYLQSDGASPTKLSQDVSLSVNTVYALTFQARMNANSVSGTLVIQITDDTGTVLTNDAGADLEATYNLNGGAGELTTAYQQFTVFFSTPRQLPSTVQIRAGYGVAGVSTRQLFLDLLQMFTPTALYGASGTGTSGPFVAIVSGVDESALSDSYTITVTNSLTPQSFALGMQRLYDLRGSGVYIPSSTSPTISDSLVTH